MKKKPRSTCINNSFLHCSPFQNPKLSSCKNFRVSGTAQSIRHYNWSYFHIDKFNIILPSTLSINFLHPTPKEKQASTFDKRLNFQKHCSDHFSGSGKGRRNPRNYKCDVVSKFCPGLLVRT